MSLFGFTKRPSARPGQVQKPVLKKPVQKPGLFEKGKQVPIKRLLWETKKGFTKIPGTGGKLYSHQALAKRLKEISPYQKFKTYLNIRKAKKILRNLRGEAYRNPAKKIKLDRERRIFEEKFEKEWPGQIKGKY
jgi:hypothetical protein